MNWNVTKKKNYFSNRSEENKLSIHLFLLTRRELKSGRLFERTKVQVLSVILIRHYPSNMNVVMVGIYGTLGYSRTCCQNGNLMAKRNRNTL